MPVRKNGGKGLSLLEIPADEGGQRLQRSFRVLTGGTDLEGGAVSGCEHHEAHDAFSIDPFIVFFDDDVAGEAARGLDELGGGPGVDAQLVSNRELALDDISL